MARRIEALKQENTQLRQINQMHQQVITQMRLQYAEDMKQFKKEDNDKEERGGNKAIKKEEPDASESWNLLTS